LPRNDVADDRLSTVIDVDILDASVAIEVRIVEQLL